jgi:hypothetical protein
MLFAPVAPAAMTQQYGQMASAPVYSAPAAQPIEYVQPVQYVEAPASDSQFWLWTGAGALAMVGAAAAARNGQTSTVAALDEEDLEMARVATLAVGGKKGRGGKSQFGYDKSELPREGGFSLTSFLMSGRKNMFGDAAGELELLSGATKPASDDSKVLANRFAMPYDSRSRSVGARAKPQAKAKGGAPVTFRSKNARSSFLYPQQKKK